MKQIISLFVLSMVMVQFVAANGPFPTPPESFYAIQLMATENPQADLFSHIKDVGYIYAESAGKFQRVFIGRFDDKATAEETLAKVKTLGFKDAFLANKKVKADALVYTVQLHTYAAGENITWDKYQVYDDLQVNLNSDGRIKIMTGSFTSLQAVNDHLQAVRAKGANGAFIKQINEAFLHKATKFEIEMSEGITMGDVSIKGGLYIPKPSDVPQSYEEFNKTSRTSVKKLQNLLATNSNYKGSIDGVYGIGTEDALGMFEAKNERYTVYKELAKKMEDPGVKDIGLQYYVNEVYDNPLMAYGGLKEVTHPMADVYLAYMYFTGKANTKGEDKQAIVNKLMNSAVQKVFVTGTYKGTTELDYSKTYNYDNITLIIKHLSYMQDAMQDPPSLPCWMFENHPNETAAIFNKLYSMVSGCGDFMEWEELKVLKTIAQDLDPVNHTLNPKAEEDIKMAYDSRRAQLYLAPTVSKEEAMVMETWHDNLWAAMNKWKDADPLHEKMVLPLEVAYYQALVKLENHYLGRGFKEEEAKILGLSVMRTVVNYHLGGYVR